VNEQWPDYWVNLFIKRGYVPVDCIRKKIWSNEEVSFWYAQNIILFVRDSVLKNNKLLKEEYDKTVVSFLSLVHPRIYLHMARRYRLITSFIPCPVKWLASKFMRK